MFKKPSLMSQRNFLWRKLVVLDFLLFLTLPKLLCAAESTDPSQQAAQDKEGCIRNLKTIYAAIQAYEKDKKDLPNWFSDLVPEYLPDVTVLMCPVSRRTGKTEPPGLADPKVASSYLFEFCPLPLANELPSAPTKTRREWKLRQVELLGPGVPVVRCRQHSPLLNIGLDGRLYESPLMWEELFTNKASLGFLTPKGIFSASKPDLATTRKTLELKIPPRDPQTPKNLLDLTAAYNALLTETWHGGEINNNNLAAIESGVQNFGGVDFDVRGIVQLAGKSLSGERFPPQVTGINMKQKCKKLHFLHATGWGKPEEDGKQVGSYLVSFVGEQTRLEVPIVYGKDVRDWHWQPGEAPAPKSLKTAWHGENEMTRQSGQPLRLYLTTWTNLLPDLEVDSITCASSMANPALFLLAITAE
jgi:hypothetical protein